MNTLSPSLLRNTLTSNKSECLVTNGKGSFASLAVTGGLARKYHGLLIHSAIPPMERHLTWHACAETLNGISLDARQWQEGTSVHCDHGEKYLIEFAASPIPTWLYQVNGHLLKKELFMEQGKSTTLVKYSLLASPHSSVTLKLSNYAHFRPAGDSAEQLSATTLNNWNIEESKNQITSNSLSLKLFCQTQGQKSWSDSHWITPNKSNQINGLIYPIEIEDQGYLLKDTSVKIHHTDVELFIGECCYMIGTLEENWPFAPNVYQQEIKRKQQQFSDNSFANDLSHCALQFVSDRLSVKGKTILAGYPWFGDWGRDTMISLPGLTLATGQFETAQSILKTFAHYLNAGMLPNKFPDRHYESLDYHSIDASLWFIWAIQQYADITGDWEFVKNELAEDIQDIIRHFKQGTHFGIGMDEDGLISGGNANTQLTWMDVNFDNTSITPRFGKAVEINALWYNALCFAKQCCDRFKHECVTFNYLIPQVKKSFQQMFWNAKLGYCNDFVAQGIANEDLRCNQIIAVSLPYSPLERDQQASIFQTVYEKLFTPVGLRSLSSEHVDYKGTYYGSLKNRDLAYHQGTVWAWLIGPFIDAAIKVKGDKVLAENLMRGLKQHFYTEAGIHGISEVFDGNPPHLGRGCFNQAWSVGECLRVIHKYQLNVPD